MENVLKGIHLLTNLDQETANNMAQDALLMWQEVRVEFKIFKISEKDVTIGVSQKKTDSDEYLTQKQLIQLVHNGFDKYFCGLRVLVHASPYQNSPAQHIDAAWIKQKMLTTGTKLKYISADTGIDHTHLSSLINGNKPLSDVTKAMFYFYFAAREK